jgi:hypothetical protein
MTVATFVAARPREVLRRASCARGRARQGMVGSAKDGEAGRARRCAGRWLLVGNQRRRVPDLGWECGEHADFKLHVLQEETLIVFSVSSFIFNFNCFFSPCIHPFCFGDV